MRQNITELFTSLYNGSISKEEFIWLYFKGKEPKDEYLLNLFKDGIINNNAVMIEEAVVLLLTNSFTSSLYVNELCELLQETWHTKHEDIAMLLKEISDPLTVNCLFKAAEIQFEYLAYDDTYQFARKCIKAISSINSENAINKLKLLSHSKIEKISEYARKELLYKEL